MSTMNITKEKIEVNPVAASGGRRVWECPPHFTKVQLFGPGNGEFMNTVGFASIPNPNIIATVRNWLYEHVENRFFLGDAADIVNDNIINDTYVAFEDPADATYFSLIRPSLIKK